LTLRGEEALDRVAVARRETATPSGVALSRGGRAARALILDRIRARVGLGDADQRPFARELGVRGELLRLELLPLGRVVRVVELRVSASA
jgi:hypothetical protein